MLELRLFFGLQTDDIEAARLEVERLLGVRLHGRNNLPWDDYYSNWPETEDEIALHFNWFDWEDDVKAADYDRYPLVLELSAPRNPETQEAALKASPLLRAERVADTPAPPPGYWDEAESKRLTRKRRS